MPAKSAERLRRFLILTAVIVVIVGVFFRDYWLRGHYLTLNDYHSFSYPTKTLLMEALRAGRFDCWNPYQYGGQPLYALFLYGPFYPPNLLLSFLPIPDQFMWGAMFHLYLGALFMYLWLRRLSLEFLPALTGALLFCFSPFVIRHVTEIDNVMRTIVWIPLIFYAGRIIIDGWEIVGSLLLAFAMAMMIVAGHIQFTYYTLLAFILYYTHHSVTILLRERSRARALKLMISFGLVLLLAIGLSAIQLFPSWYAAGLTTRAETVSWRFVSSYSLTPDQLLNLLMPGFWQGWGMTDGSSFPFLGVLAPFLMLAALAGRPNRETCFCAAMTVLALVIALGKFTPFFHLLFLHFPGFTLFRGPSRFLLIYVFFGCTLAAYGLSVLLQGEFPRRRWLTVPAGLLAALTAGGLVGMVAAPAALLAGWRRLVIHAYAHWQVGQTRPLEFYLERLDPGHLSAPRQALAVLLLLLIAFIVLLQRRGRISPRRWAGLLLGLILLPLLAHSLGLLQLQPPGEYSLPRPLADLIRAHNPEPLNYFRVAQYGYLDFNQGTSLRLGCLDGYGGIIISHYSRLVSVIENEPLHRLSPRASIGIQTMTSPALNLVGARYLITREPVSHPRLEPLAADRGFILYRNRGALPALFAVGQVRLLDEEANAAYLRNEQSYPLTTLILPTGYGSPERQPPDLAPVAVTVTPVRALPDDREWTITAAGPAYLVVTENYYPFWRFELDGRPHPLWRAYYYLLGTRIPAGTHRLRLHFVPLDLYLGAAVSGLAALIFLWLLLFAARRRLVHNIRDDEDILFDYLSRAPASLALVRGMEGKLFRRSRLTSPILDIGCGDGLFASMVFRQPIDVGIDLNPNELRKVPTPDRYRARINANTRSLPFRSNHFQTVISNCVFEHVPSLDAPFAEIHRVLKPGGKYVFTTHSHLYGDYLFWRDACYRLKLYRLGDWYARSVNRVFKHHSMLSPPQWQALLQRSGFREVRISYYLSRRAMHIFDLLLPGSLPARLNQALWGRWAILPRRFLAAVHTHVFKRFYNETPMVGAGLCLEARK